MANYVENVKVGSGETWPIRDADAIHKTGETATDLTIADALTVLGTLSAPNISGNTNVSGSITCTAIAATASLYGLLNTVNVVALRFGEGVTTQTVPVRGRSCCLVGVCVNPNHLFLSVAAISDSKTLGDKHDIVGYGTCRVEASSEGLVIHCPEYSYGFCIISGQW
jgi:hypothetical protein